MAGSLEQKIAEALEPLIEDVVRLERADGNALLEAQGMKSLEAAAMAVRDYCQRFTYERTSAEATTGAKRLPLWLR